MAKSDKVIESGRRDWGKASTPYAAMRQKEIVKQ
jgi:hypothetical protein